MRLVISFTIILISLSICAQDPGNYKGKLVDVETKVGVPFATIKLKNEWRGVITNATGLFQLPGNIKDSLIISCIGYKSKVISIAQISRKELNIINLEPSTTELSEVVIKANKIKGLSAYKIIKNAIQRIPINYDHSDFSYLAYYRDYQIKNEEYINLNEAVVEVFDPGFDTKTNIESAIKLYQYRKNRDFKRDSLTELAYDNLSTKFIPNAKLHPFGGNELSILFLHDAIRNYRVYTYSFINRFKRNFLFNHTFQLRKLVKMDSVDLYEITFNTISDRIIALNHFAKGAIYIEPDNYAIHRLDYSTYSFNDLDISHDSTINLLYDIKVEYSRMNSRMYLNYISFNNFFKVKNPEDFKVVGLVLDRGLYAFRIEFNNIPSKSSILDKSHYKIKIDGENMVISEIVYEEEYRPKIIDLFLERNTKVNIWVSKETLANMINVDFTDIYDVEGRKLAESTYLSVNQFRELFVQNIDLSPTGLQDSLVVNINKPLSENAIYPKSGRLNLFMNTPLKKYQEK